MRARLALAKASLRTRHSLTGRGRSLARSGQPQRRTVAFTLPEGRNREAIGSCEENARRREETDQEAKPAGRIGEGCRVLRAGLTRVAAHQWHIRRRGERSRSRRRSRREEDGAKASLS